MKLVANEWMFNKVKQAKIIDPRYTGIAVKMIKSAEEGKSITTIFSRYKLLNVMALTNFANTLEENHTLFVVPEQNYTPFDLSSYNLPVKQKIALSTLCWDHKVFPYKVAGSGIIWVSSEIEETGNYLTELNSIIYTISAKILNIPTAKIKSSVKFMIEPVFEGVFDRFCTYNDMPSQSPEFFMPSPEVACGYYLAKGIVMNASDIFFDPKVNGIQVCYSILNDTLEDDFVHFSSTNIDNFMNKALKLASFEPTDRQKQQIVLNLSIKDLAEQENKYNGRVNVFRNGDHDSICIRVVDKTKKCIPFKDLNIRDSVKERIRNLLHNNAGIVLVAGATGSGKTTSIYSMIGELVNIFPYKRKETVEDPVEQILDHVSQLTLEKSGATYDAVAESLTRRNPKILFVGEFNTPKTIRFGVNAALQDLYIISTIHSIDASLVPDRIRGLTTQDPSTFEQLLLVLRGIIHQTMLKECCPNCIEMVDVDGLESKHGVRITNSMKDVLKYYKYFEDKVPIAYHNPECKMCHGRGFLIDKPIIAVEVCCVDDLLRERLQGIPTNKIAAMLYEEMRKINCTGVQDALGYMRQGRVDWMQIWDRFSLTNKASKAIAEGDEKYGEKDIKGSMYDM